MIPLTLQIKNFLSYGESWTTVDFTPYQFICLTGRNGHGKSALLDAITWALWGQARKISGTPRADDALVRLGQRHMAVIFDFTCQQQRYTVRRELVLYQDKTKLILDFGVFDQSTQRTRSLTEKTIRQTQQSIQTAIGLDFDAFSNSVFLRQGQSNEFSKKTAQERKQILSSILGIDQYETLRKQLLDRIRALETEKKSATQLHAHLNEQYTKISEVRYNYTACNQAYTDLQTQEQERVTQHKALHEQKNNLTAQQELYLTTKKELDNKTQLLQLQRNQQELNSAQKIKEYELMLLQHQTELKTVQTKKDDLSTRSQELAIAIGITQKKVDELALFINTHTAIEPIFIAAKTLFDKRKDTYQRMIAHGNSTHNELKLASQQLELTARAHHAQCPLCQQQLSQKHHLHVHQQLAQQTSFLKQRIKRIEGFLQSTKEILSREHENIKQKEYILQQINQTHARIDELKKQQIIMQEEYTNTQKSLMEIATACTQKEQDLAKFTSKLNTIKQHIKEQTEQDPATQELVQHIESIQKKLNELAIDYSKIQARLEHIQEQERVLEHTLENIRTQKNLMAEKRGRLVQELEHLEIIRAESIKQQDTINNLALEIEDHELMAQALSKDGIQALLIDSVIPEIEDEANFILARLSEQQTRIFIESLRDLKSGGSRETLDIKISDATGIRPYELFSGGEAFRIDFALRIALSKLLARRAGASLQTLIIDEGFGSQDEEGLSLIMDMLYKIQDSFAKVIIVSHLSALKEQVPVQFMVEKLASGSSIRIIEQT